MRLSRFGGMLMSVYIDSYKNLTLLTVSFAVQKLWSLIRSHLSILAFVANALSVLVMKSLPTPMS